MITVTLEQFDSEKMNKNNKSGAGKNYAALVRSLSPGKMLTVQFPEGTNGKEIHRVRKCFQSTGVRLKLYRLATKTDGTTLYVWIGSTIA